MNTLSRLFSKEVSLPGAASVGRMTLLFFSLPLYIFLAGWIQYAISLPLFFLISFGFYKVYREFDLLPRYKIQVSLWRLLLILTLLLLWVLSAGVGMFHFQNGDYVKHNAILNDLIFHSWPVAYEVEGVNSIFTLVYYFGYYLVPALLGKITGSPEVALWTQLIQTLLGVCFAVYWLCTLMGKIRTKYIIFFIFFSGLDFLGHIFAKGEIPKVADHIEWWARVWQFSGNTSLLYWVPQHALPGWCFAFLLIYLTRIQVFSFHLLLGPLAVLWSPFVGLGLALLGGIYLLVEKSWKNAMKPTFLILALIAGGISSFFLLSKMPDEYHGWILIPRKINLWMPYLPLFLFLELGVYLVPMMESWRDFSEKRVRVLWLSFVCLLGLLVYKYGMYNDLAMRSSIPFLALICFEIMNYLKKATYSASFKILMLIWCFGTLNSIQEVSRGFLFRHPHRFPRQSVLKMRSGFVKQYLAKRNSFFHKYLGKKAHSKVVQASEETKEFLSDLEF